MLKHHLKLALRYFVRHKGHSVLNVAGLAVGLACCLLIAAYVRDELQYDRLHARRDRIYRVTFQLEGFAEGANNPAPLGPYSCSRVGSAGFGRANSSSPGAVSSP